MIPAIDLAAAARAFETAIWTGEIPMARLCETIIVNGNSTSVGCREVATTTVGTRPACASCLAEAQATIRAWLRGLAAKRAA